MKSIFCAIVVLIIYGSLYPFNFSFYPVHLIQFEKFLHTWGEFTDYADLISNVMLFIPFGYFARLAFINLPSVAISLLGLLLSAGLQVLQIYLPSRDANLSDVGWNLAGVFVGLILARFFALSNVKKWSNSDEFYVFPFLLLICWLCYKLFPFVPSFDWGLIKMSLAPLFTYPNIKWIVVFQNTVAWAIFARLWINTVQVNHSMRGLMLVVLLVFIAEVVIIYNQVDINDIMGTLSGFMITWILMRRRTLIDGSLAFLLIVMLVTVGLSPFTLSGDIGKIHLLPFYGFLHGSALNNLSVGFIKLFFYGSLVWLLRQVGLRFTTIAVIGVSVTLFIEIAQMFFRWHTSEITDPLLVLMLSFVIFTFEKSKFNRVNPIVA